MAHDKPIAPYANQPSWKNFPSTFEDKIATARTWLNGCESTHPYCKPTIGLLPKRLIEIGTSNGPGHRLVCCQDIEPANIRYATLSYSWGKSLPIRTTKTNVDLYSEQIPNEILPRTFQDAFTIARALDIFYIWIDSLCIVQNDEDEWQSEASRMSDIYSGSLLTIAASDAENTSNGCFSLGSSASPDNSSIEKRAFFMITQSENTSKKLVQVVPRHGGRGRTSILHTRGWVLQETVLSHRTVQVMDSELFWQCRSGCQTETGASLEISESICGSVPTLDLKSSSDPHKLWWGWMESYSRRNFTFLKDRLPALAGLVQYYQESTGDLPLLGLWKSSLHQDLLWIRISKLPQGETSVAQQSKVPSWSWLSCMTEISFDFFGSKTGDTEIYDHITMIECDVSWTSRPFVSDIESSRLVISGPVKHIFFGVAPEAEDCNPPYCNVKDEVPDFSKKPLPWRCVAQFDREHRRPPARHLCLLIRSRVSSKTGYRVETFLILEEAPSCASGVKYCRIGLGMLRGYTANFDLGVRQTVHLI